MKQTNKTSIPLQGHWEALVLRLRQRGVPPEVSERIEPGKVRFVSDRQPDAFRPGGLVSGSAEMWPEVTFQLITVIERSLKQWSLSYVMRQNYHLTLPRGPSPWYDLRGWLGVKSQLSICPLALDLESCLGWEIQLQISVFNQCFLIQGFSFCKLCWWRWVFNLFHFELVLIVYFCLYG